MKQYFLIQEVASLHNISKKTLLHYDRIGLFVPDHIDPETGYRYYVREQFPFIKQIIYFKDLGFSLKEIQTLLDDRRMEPVLVKIDEKLEEVNRQLDKLKSTKYDLTYLKNFYTMAQQIDERDLNTPGIKFLESRTMVFELCESGNNTVEVMLAYRKILRKMINLSNISQMPYGTIIVAPEDEDGEYGEIMGSFTTLPKPLGMEHEICAERGKYAYMYKKGGYYDPASLEILLNWCKEKGYTPVGNVYDFSIIDYTFSKSESEMIQEIQVRII